MSEPLWVYIIFGVYTVLALGLYLSARHKVQGLLGAYGKGVWSESSIFMREARESHRKFLSFFVIVLFFARCLTFTELTT